MTTAGQPLATIAAVHVLLATHPELSVLPIGWDIEGDGTVTAQPPYMHPDSETAARALADVLGTELREHLITTKEGTKLVNFSLCRPFAGASIYCNAYAPAPEDGAQ